MLELLVGNIASGKSTYAKKRVQEGWFCVSDDAIINMLLADQYSLYSRKHEQLVADLLLQCAEKVVAENYLLVVDSAWLVSKRYRQRFREAFSNLVVEEIWFLREAPEVHAARRVEHDPRGGTYEMWLEVAKRLDSLY